MLGAFTRVRLVQPATTHHMPKLLSPSLAHAPGPWALAGRSRGVTVVISIPPVRRCTGAPMTQTPPYQVTDPATGEVAQKFPFATDAEVEQALASATEAFAAWKRRPVAERAAI